jgi:ketosteroid isomerase-like protein
MKIVALLLASSMSVSSSPRSIIEELFRAFNRHDVSALQALYSPDARLMSSDFCKARTGTDVTRTYAALFRAFPGIRDEVISMVVDGDQAAVRFMTSSVVEGNEMNFELMTFLRFKDGRIVEDITIFDTKGRPCDE